MQQYRSGQAAQAIAEQQATYQRQAAGEALRRGEREAGLARQQAAAVAGAQKVGYGAGNVALQSGSPLAVISDTKALGELDAQMVRNNAAKQAWGLKTEAQTTLYEGAMRKSIAAWSAGATIMTGAYDFYKAMKK